MPEPILARYGPLYLLKDDRDVRTLMGAGSPGGETVVLRIAGLDSVGRAAAARLSHEVAVLKSLGDREDRPVLLEHGVDKTWVWTARPFYSGRSLAERLAGGPLGVDDTLQLAAEVLRQLVVVHSHGLVHRGIKPANIVMPEDASDGGVRAALLVDFGVTRSAHLDPSAPGVRAEEVRYCSPEQAGMIDAPPDERSDLYSLGLILFECLAGRPLLDGSGFGEVQRQHLEPRIIFGQVEADLPRAFAEMIGRLVRPDPSQRYQEADAVLADVEAIAAGRRDGLEDPPVVIGRRDRRNSLTDPGLVGRRGELSALEAELRSARGGRGGVVSIEGESGSGKSRLLEEVAQLAASSGMLVLRGQAEDRTASRPFQIFAGVAADLAAAADRDPDLGTRLYQCLSERAEAVARAAPPLAQFTATGSASQAMPEEHGQARAVEALATVLQAAGSENRPALVILDDCQWAPGLAADVLAQWTARPGQRWTLVVAAFRSEEVPISSPLRALDTSRDMLIADLTDGQVEDLVSSMAGPVPEEAVGAVVRAAKGNAFMAQAVLRGMIESGALVRAGDEWRLNSAVADEMQTSREAAFILVRRLEVLPAAARRLVAATAVIGKAADLDLSVTLSALESNEAVPAIAEARRRRILWLDERNNRLVFAHDMLRETILEALPAAEQVELHQRAAQLFLARPEEGPFQVAYHLDMAGRPADAYPHALRAAESARARHALEDAETYYLIARKGAPDDRSRFLVADGLAEVAALSGRYLDAETYLREAAELATDSLDQAAEVGKLGEVAFRRGDQATAASHLETALRRLGVRIPGRKVALFAALLWEVAVQIVHTAGGNRLTRKRPLRPGDELRLRFYSRLAYVYWFRNGTVRCLWAHLRELNLAERSVPSAALAQAYSEHAPVMTTIPWYSRGIRYASRSLALRRQLGDTWGEGQSLNFYGVALYAASRYVESVEAFEEAVRILSLTGDRWEMNTALWNLALAHYRRGEWAAAGAIAADLHDRAERIGDQTSSAIALSILAKVSSGFAPEEAAIDLAASRPNDDQHAGSEIRLARALHLLAGDRCEEAASILESSWAAVRRAGLRQEYVAPVLPWWATALRRQADQMARDDPERRRVLRRARRVSRRAVRLSRFYRNNLPHALREEALTAIRNGRQQRGRALLKKSALIAAGQGARWEEAISRAELARFEATLGTPGAQAELELYQLEVAEIEAAGRGDGA